MGIFTSKHLPTAIAELAQAIAALGRVEQRERVGQLLSLINKANVQGGIEEHFSLMTRFEPKKCKQCGKVLAYSPRMNRSMFCSGACKVAYHRAKKAGQAVSESASQQGGHDDTVTIA
jgi:ferredoxin